MRIAAKPSKPESQFRRRKFKSNVLACQRVVRVFNAITVARTLLLFMQIAIADRKRVAALKKIWNKKMQEVQAVMASTGRTTRVNRERMMVRRLDLRELS
jgi:hypothetical protein